MQLCTKTRVLNLIKQGWISVANVDSTESLFLDDVRAGLRLSKDLLEVDGPINLEQPSLVPCRKVTLADTRFMPGQFYVGISMEEFSLPDNIMAIVYTRSKYARIGLEMVRSSVFVIPGFGRTTPTPIVFEISTSVEVTNLTSDEKYAFLLFYELTNGIELTASDYKTRFPLMFLG